MTDLRKRFNRFCYRLSTPSSFCLPVPSATFPLVPFSLFHCRPICWLECEINKSVRLAVGGGLALWRACRLYLAHSLLDLKRSNRRHVYDSQSFYFVGSIVISLSVHNWAVWVVLALKLQCPLHSRVCHVSPSTSSQGSSFPIDFIAGSRIQETREIFIAQFSAR
jgi:hypothetical protein